MRLTHMLSGSQGIERDTLVRINGRIFRPKQELIGKAIDEGVMVRKTTVFDIDTDKVPEDLRRQLEQAPEVTVSQPRAECEPKPVWKGRVLSFEGKDLDFKISFPKRAKLQELLLAVFQQAQWPETLAPDRSPILKGRKKFTDLRGTVKRLERRLKSKRFPILLDMESDDEVTWAER